MLILGLDPGTRIAGYGLVEALGPRLTLAGMGVLTAPPAAPVEERLAAISRGLRAVLEGRRPDAVAMEDAFVRVDPRAALLVGQGPGC